MLYHETDVDSSEVDAAEAARARLFTYNRNDVDATAALYSFGSTTTSACLAIESLGS